MHSLSVPVNLNETLDENKPPMESLKKFFDFKLKEISDLDVNPERVIVDPGLGFGKTARQNFELLREVHQLQEYNCPILVGHSRKSFLSHFSPQDPKKRDAAGVGISVIMGLKGVDLLRVHNPLLHKQAWLAANKLKRENGLS